MLVAILAMLLLVVGGALGSAAIWAHGSFDDSGVMRFDAGTIDPGPDARSTIVDIDRFSATIPYIGELGTTRLSVSTGETADPSNTLFIGAAATPDVDTFVRGSAYAVGIKDGGVWTIRAVPGSLIPPLPRDQDFWLAQDVGRNPGIVVPGARPLTLLVMHPSGIPSGPLVLSTDFVIPTAGQWVLGMAIAAGVLLLVGLFLLVLVFRMRGRRGRHEAAVAAAPDAEAGEDTAEAVVVEEAIDADDEPVLVVDETVVVIEPMLVVAEPDPVVDHPESNEPEKHAAG